MPRKSTGSKDRPVKKFVQDLRQLDASIPDDLRLASLSEKPPRLEGYACKYALLLPILAAKGERVFTDEHLTELVRLVSRRFGGCLALSASAHPPLYGFYEPAGRDPEKDYHTQLLVLANPIDAADAFFTELKAILRTAPLIPQEEIVIERSHVKLM
ncbi:MAG: hypothetical protein L0Z62_18045 [Gemmataceae bacterium]|nr:hypothetical protein [Gemmataceae bacterium]